MTYLTFETALIESTARVLAFMLKKTEAYLGEKETKIPPNEPTGDKGAPF